MNNPFDTLETRLSNIEAILLDIKHKPKQNLNKQIEESDKLLNVEQTAEFLRLTIPTIYTKVSKSELPVMKQGNRLYFSRKELLDYLKDGRRKTIKEIQIDADNYLISKNKR